MKISLQEIFDRAYIGVMKQGCPCEQGNSCVYFGYDGKKCAIGHVIAGTRISSNVANIDKLIINDFYDIYGYLGHEPSHNFSCFLRAIQKAHDNADVNNFVKDFHRDMEFIANEYNLTIPKI